MTYKTIKIKDINVNGIIKTPLLPEGFIKRGQKFKKILAEVETTTLEQTVANFQQDRHSERELKLWEHIAFNYQNFIKANPNLTLEEKKDVFRVLLSLSMGIENFNDIKNLSKQQVQCLIKNYKDYR